MHVLYNETETNYFALLQCITKTLIILCAKEISFFVSVELGERSAVRQKPRCLCSTDWVQVRKMDLKLYGDGLLCFLTWWWAWLTGETDRAVKGREPQAVMDLSLELKSAPQSAAHSVHWWESPALPVGLYCRRLHPVRTQLLAICSVSHSRVLTWAFTWLATGINV